jgi:hypothetical protein
MTSRLAHPSIAFALLALSGAAHAEETGNAEGTVGEPDAKTQCASAYELSQEKRKAEQLISAREQLKICIRDICPAFVRDECTEWLAEVEASLPTVVLAARRGDQDLIDVRVAMDGKPIADKLTATAIALDPGVHVFRFELEGFPPIEQRVVVRVTEKNRRVAVLFENEEGDDIAENPYRDANAEGSTGILNKRTASYALAGLGAAALGSFAFFALTGKSDENDLRDRCSPNCPESDVDSVRTKYLVADISFGVGIASLGAATWLYLTSNSDSGNDRRESVRRKPPALGLAVQPTRGGAFLGFTRDF